MESDDRECDLEASSEVAAVKTGMSRCAASASKSLLSLGAAKIKFEFAEGRSVTLSGR